MRTSGASCLPSRSSAAGLLFLTLALAALLGACDAQLPTPLASPASAGTLRIVSSLPSKGIYGPETEQTRRAIDAALRTYTPANGINLEHVALEGSSDETGEWTAAIEERNARAAAGDQSVIAYIGPHNSGAAAMALPFTSRAGLLQSSPSATWPGLTRLGWNPGEPDKFYAGTAPNFVRLIPDDSRQALAAAQWFADDGHRRALVLHDGSTYSEAMAGAFATRLDSPTTEIVQVDTSAYQVVLPSPVGYDAVFFAPSSVQSASRLALALRKSDVAVYSTDVALDPQFLEVVGEAGWAWHIVSNSAAPLAGPISALFPDTPPDVAQTRPALSAYVITRLAIEAIGAGATRRDEVLAQVRSRRLPDGSPLFDEGGDAATWTLTGYRPAGSKFESVREFGP